MRRARTAAQCLGDDFKMFDESTTSRSPAFDLALTTRVLTVTGMEATPEPAPLGTGPLGDVTPVATSATLGDDGDPARMLEFAETVFGTPFAPDSVVRETRQSGRQWVQGALASGNRAALSPRGLDNSLVADVVRQGYEPFD